MSTIESPAIIKTMLLNDGIYPGDPQMGSIWQYDNDEGKRLYKQIYAPGMLLEFLLSPYVTAPLPLWSREKGLTDFGRQFLDEFKDLPRG